MKIALFALLLVAGSLRAMDVNAEFDKTVNFSNYKTFRIVSGELTAKASPLKSDVVKKNLETQIRTQLQAKHLTEVKGSADLAIRYSLGASRKAPAKEIPAERLGGRLRPIKKQEIEGILTIDILAGDRALIWRSVAVEDNRDPSKVAKKLDEMIQKSFDKYPPKN